MKILMVNKFLYPNGGSETYVFELGKALCKCGHEVQYFGMEHEDNIVGNEANAYTQRMDFHKAGALEKLSYSLATIYSKNARVQLRKVLDQFEPDVVHLNNFTYQLTPSIILETVKWRKENGKNTRIVFTAHDYNLICPNHMLYNPTTEQICERCLGGHFLNCTKGKCIHNSTMKSVIGTLEGAFWKAKKVYRYIDQVICCSEFMKQKMDTAPVFAGKTVAIHNFVRDYTFELPEKGDYVLYFGRFSKEKGIGTLIEACKANPDIRFVFAGSGPLESDLRDVPNIENRGFLSGDELRNTIKGALFSVYPSEWYENCPFSVMESEMYGTPVLGARIGGIPELIREGVNGELFESGNVNELSSGIRELYQDREKLSRYTAACADLDFDTVDTYVEKLLKLYRN